MGNSRDKIMNIYTVKSNLVSIIQRKEQALSSWRKMADDDDGLDVICSLLTTNIQELKDILADVDCCCQQEIEQSWKANPDRSGGQFSDDEINRDTY
jgi:hypothetical protein